jgi:hypothetical protein
VSITQGSFWSSEHIFQHCLLNFPPIRAMSHCFQFYWLYSLVCLNYFKFWFNDWTPVHLLLSLSMLSVSEKMSTFSIRRYTKGTTLALKLLEGDTFEIHACTSNFLLTLLISWGPQTQKGKPELFSIRNLLLNHVIISQEGSLHQPRSCADSHSSFNTQLRLTSSRKTCLASRSLFMPLSLPSLGEETYTFFHSPHWIAITRSG